MHISRQTGRQAEGGFKISTDYNVRVIQEICAQHYFSNTDALHLVVSDKTHCKVYLVV